VSETNFLTRIDGFIMMPLWRSLIFILLCFVSINAQEARRFIAEDFPNGLNIYNADKCWKGYTLVPYEDGMILIIDMKGNVVHHWNVGTERARLLDNGNIVVMQGSSIVEYNWDGNRVWDFDVPGSPFPETGYPSPGFIHHDLQRLSNGNTIFIIHEEVPKEFKELIKDPVRKTSQIIGDCFMEVNPHKEIVWLWHAHEGLNLNKDTGIKIGDNGRFDWTHCNTVFVLPENHWYDEGHEEFKPGNVLICSRHLDEIYIIDRDTKKIVWSYRGEYLVGLSRSHEPTMIEKGLPGAGNILIFDNGMDRYLHQGKGKEPVQESTVILEIDPVSKQIVWLYQNKEFYSSIQGTEQRLDNGNTFICESTQGRIFEVTNKGEIVWQYVMPPFPGSDEEHGLGTRPHRYPYDYCPQLEKLSSVEK